MTISDTTRQKGIFDVSLCGKLLLRPRNIAPAVCQSCGTGRRTRDNRAMVESLHAHE